MVDFGNTLKSEGLLLGVESLVSQASRVKVRGGKAQVLDGPFAEAKEMIGGFFLLDCDSREEALAIAARCPASKWATVEVRDARPLLHVSAAGAGVSISPVLLRRVDEATPRSATCDS